MATTQTRIRQTGFQVGATVVRFGLLWPDFGPLMTDWTRESRYVDLAAPGFTVTQLFGFGPYRATYTLVFDTVADYRALDALAQQTGTLTVVHGGHTVPVDADEAEWLDGRAYTRMENVTLLSLASLGVAGDGSVEATATFTRTAS